MIVLTSRSIPGTPYRNQQYVLNKHPGHPKIPLILDQTLFFADFRDYFNDFWDWIPFSADQLPHSPGKRAGIVFFITFLPAGLFTSFMESASIQAHAGLN